MNLKKHLLMGLVAGLSLSLVATEEEGLRSPDGAALLEIDPSQTRHLIALIAKGDGHNIRKFFEENGVAVDARDAEGRNALFLAIQYNNNDMASFPY